MKQLFCLLLIAKLSSWESCLAYCCLHRESLNDLTLDYHGNFVSWWVHLRPLRPTSRPKFCLLVGRGKQRGPEEAEIFQDFEAHWTRVQLAQALKEGKAFTCDLRINANDRKSAFACFEGLPTDIQIQVHLLLLLRWQNLPRMLLNNN